MDLKTGDWVRTPSGQIGRVVYISRLTVFLSFADQEGPESVVAYLASELTKVDPPGQRSAQSHDR